ncbi:hypothetical protein F4V43_03375 [Paenibacillus spiritus]|uniref:Uncharacterized protein n=1 Tax=Paenibacillus spiritus TaxID=2496557 RepID=A0A5J5GHC4_9BACL|nr:MULTISPECIES: DUF6171 family protein [Paenibacillus]KAA9007545.1 hypothetical protein F4V43_03375 [Paenibacillus spiritus]
MADTSCKACREDYRVTDAQMERLLKTSMFAPDKRVAEEEYRERLQICSACPKLENGVTCRACGCIIPVVAWLKERACPLPGGGAWRVRVPSGNVSAGS